MYPHELNELQKNQRVLVVTDQEGLRQMIEGTLQPLKKRGLLFFAVNGEAGVEEASRIKPDVVLMDLGMHQLSGIDAAREIKKYCPECKIVMLTIYHCDSCPIGI